MEYPPQVGGIASYVYNLAAHLCARGTADDVVVYAPGAKGDKAFDGDKPWKTYRAKQLSKFMWPTWLKMYFQVRKIIREKKIDKLYIHHALPAGYVGRWQKKFYKVSYTLFFHGTDVEMGTRTNWKRKRLAGVVADAERVIVNSRFLQKKLTERIPVKAPVDVLYPPPADGFLTVVSPETLQTLRTKLALTGKKVILSVGRMVEGKGYPHLLHIFPSLLEQVPNAVWLIIGEGPKEPMLLQGIRKSGLQNAVRLLGVIPENLLPRYYQLADLFVLLTHPDEGREESWGMVFMEAAASGLPVVAGRSGGVAEAVADLASGLIVDVAQEQGAIKAIVDLLKNPDYARQMGQQGRERVQKEFTWEKQIAKFFQ